jgi:hypothetical protein
MNFIVFDLGQTGLESTIYRPLCKHADYYTTDVVLPYWYIQAIPINTTGATSGAGSAHHSGAPDFTPGF